jgi:hypothetical protein
VKAVNALRAPRGYEKLFQLEKLRVMAAEGQNVEQLAGDLVRNIERCKPVLLVLGPLADEQIAAMDPEAFETMTCTFHDLRSPETQFSGRG